MLPNKNAEDFFHENCCGSHGACSECSVEDYNEGLNWKRNLKFALAALL
jgi:ferredoxin